MAGETIELLKPYTPDKMQWPAMHQQKVDGVPVIVIRSTDNANPVKAYSRQGELITSIPHIIQFCTALLTAGEAVVMELSIAGKAFKEISGLVRRKAACRDLVGWAFDFIPAQGHSKPWIARRSDLATRLNDLASTAKSEPAAFCVRLLPGVIVNGPDEAQAAHDALMLANPNAEGSCFHSLEKPFQPGTRKWTTQKLKPNPTIDLYVHSFEEAISQDGKPLGMVGRINAEFTKYVDGKPVLEIIGVGPGNMNHTQRKAQWLHYKRGDYKPRIAEIKYMRDESYDALRQPTFVCWRDDKDTPDAGKDP